MAILSLVLAATLAAPSSPLVYLTKGEEAVRKKQYRAATENFEAALNTGMLNATAKSMSYWNLHYCYTLLGNLENQDRAIESLLGFIVYSLDYVDFINSLDEEDRKIHPGAVWLRSFNIENKLVWASELMGVYWEYRKNEE